MQNYGKEKKLAASASAEAAAVLNNALTNLGDLGYLQLDLRQFANHHRDGHYPADTDITVTVTADTFTVTDNKTGNVLHCENRPSPRITSPKGIVYRLPRDMREELAQATDYKRVVELIQKYRDSHVYSLDTSCTADFQQYCINVSGDTTIHVDSVSNALYYRDTK